MTMTEVMKFTTLIDWSKYLFRFSNLLLD